MRPLANPLAGTASLVVLQGNLAPLGCILKQSAMASHLKHHTGKAIVFAGVVDLVNRIDDPDLEVDTDSV